MVSFYWTLIYSKANNELFGLMYYKYFSIRYSVSMSNNKDAFASLLLWLNT